MLLVIKAEEEENTEKYMFLYFFCFFFCLLVYRVW